MDNFEIKPEIPSQYRYFDRWYGAELASFMLFGPTLAVLWAIVALYYYHSGSVAAMFIKPAVYLTAMFLIARILYRNFRSAAAGKSIVIDGDKISKRSGGAIDAFSRSDISKVRLSRLPLARRWMILESSASKESFRLPVYVRNGHKMVDRIFRNIEARGRSFDGSAALRERLYNRARRYNILQKLREKQFPRLFHAAAGVALFNAAVAMAYWERGILTALYCGVASMILQTGAYFITEALHTKKLLKAGARTDSDASFSDYYVLAGIAALLAGMVTGMLTSEFVYLLFPAYAY